MIKFLSAVLCIGVAMALTAPDGQAAKKGGSKSSGGGKGSCTDDIPITWQIVNSAPGWTFSNGPTTPSDSPYITGDSTSYADGLNGVTRSVINICSRTGDATLLLDTSANRFISVDFSKALVTNGNTPTWAKGDIKGTWFLNVRNLYYFDHNLQNYVPPNDATEYQFTTQFTSGAPNTASTHVRMLNPNVDAEPAVTAISGGTNDPYNNSPVHVYHCPYPAVSQSGPCAGVSAETWYVWPDGNPTASGTSNGYPITYVASLILDGKPHVGEIDEGEFSIPFYFIITRQ